MDALATKKCSGCGFDYPREMFHKRAASSDGLASRCKVCQSDYDRQRLHDPKRVEQRRQYQQTDTYKEKHNAISLTWGERNRIKTRAHSAVRRALKNGTLVRQPCEVCGTEDKVEAHHDDYNNPLDVKWLCDPHHKQRHIELRLEARPFQDQRWKINSQIGVTYDEPELEEPPF